MAVPRALCHSRTVAMASIPAFRKALESPGSVGEAPGDAEGGLVADEGRVRAI